MEQVARLLNEMCSAGVITAYALFGAVAQMRYTEAVATFDANVLVAVPRADALDVLGPLYAFCRNKGYTPHGEAIEVGSWPVQFIPVFSALTREAVEHAETGEICGIPLRVVRADYLAVIALSVGRAKDLVRVQALLESESVATDGIAALAARHGLTEAWERFRRRHLDD